MTTPASDQLANVVAVLTCGCVVDLGSIPHRAPNPAPKRKDGKFAALKCRHGRRKIHHTVTSFVYERGQQPDPEENQ